MLDTLSNSRFVCAMSSLMFAALALAAVASPIL